MEKMLALYGDQAREAGVYIVSACGFDCIPNDLGTLVLEKNFHGDLEYIESYMTTENVRFNDIQLALIFYHVIDRTVSVFSHKV